MISIKSFVQEECYCERFDSICNGKWRRCSGVFILVDNTASSQMSSPESNWFVYYNLHTAWDPGRGKAITLYVKAIPSRANGLFLAPFLQAAI